MLKEEGAAVRLMSVGRYYCRLGCDQDEVNTRLDKKARKYDTLSAVASGYTVFDAA